MTYPEGRQPIEPQDMAKLHPSTWAQEVEQLRAEKQELAMQVLASEGQAEEAYQAQLSAEAAASWADIKANQAVEEAKALRSRVEALEVALGKIVTLCHTYPGIADGAGEIARAALQQPIEPHTASHSAKSTPPKG